MFMLLLPALQTSCNLGTTQGRPGVLLGRFTTFEYFLAVVDILIILLLDGRRFYLFDAHETIKDAGCYLLDYIDKKQTQSHCILKKGRVEAIPNVQVTKRHSILTHAQHTLKHIQEAY